jgi:predicted RNA-binding Zn ribbon-like protein
VTDAIRLRAPDDPRPKVDVGRPFRRLNGGWLGLDFVNTVPGWLSDPEHESERDWGDRIAGERLVAYGDLALWSRLEDLMDEPSADALVRAATADPETAALVVERAHGFRASLYRLFRAAIEEWAPLQEDIEVLNRERAVLVKNEVVVRSGAAYGTEWHGRASDLQALLWPPLRSALALLTDPELLARVGRCGGPECGWLFIDVGRGRRRRWCDSRDCGNIVKVRAYRRRQRGERP